MEEIIKGIPVEHITDKEQIYNMQQELFNRLDTLALVRDDKDCIIITDYKEKCMLTFSLDENGNVWKITRW